MRLVLASSSPRRRELLRLLGIGFVVRAHPVDETRYPGEPPATLVRRLAKAKARAAVDRGAADELILAADTVVALGDTVFGKPADRSDALAMLARLSDATHWVYTAVALYAAGQLREAVSASQVTFREIPDAEARAYWDSGEPADKAGAYAIQGYGASFVRSLQGSHSGVVGLPLVETLELLCAAGVLPQPAKIGGDVVHA